jgi:hypothetical protein
MNIFLPGMENIESLVLTGLVTLVILTAAFLILKKIFKKKQFFASKPKIADYPNKLPDFKPEINLLRRMIPSVQPRGIRKTAPSQRDDIDIIAGRDDITQSLLALVEKYSLGTFTIATADGLVFASTGGDDAHTSAATYDMMDSQDPDSKTSTVIISDLTHKGSTLVGIIRTQYPVSQETIRKITADTQTILNWWV